MNQYMQLPSESRLTLFALAEGLTRAGKLSAKNLARLRGVSPSAMHPLVYLAEQRLPDLSRPGEIHEMDSLLAFLAEDTDQPVYDIDPLKIEIAAISEVLSRAFAQRHRILAVEITADQVVIASADPMVRAWERDLEHVVRRPIKRVLADPREIAHRTRHCVELVGQARDLPRIG